MPTTAPRPHDRTAAVGASPASRARALTKVYGSGAAAVRALDAVDVVELLVNSQVHEVDV